MREGAVRERVAKLEPMTTPVQNIAINTLGGVPTSLGEYDGRAVLVVNVASKCGLTPQYSALEKLASEQDPKVKAAIQAAIDSVQGQLAWGERLGVLFTGASLGSILLLVALGLAITYGLMGVINMAHGELMMIGAYATYMVQNAFKNYAPGA